MRFYLSICLAASFSINVLAKEHLPPLIEKAIVQEKPFQKEIQLVGSIHARKESKLVAKTNGTIDKVFVEEGSVVKKSTIIATLGNFSEKSAYELALRNESLAKTQFHRLKKLYEDKDVSKRAVDEAELAYIKAKGDRQVAKDALDSTTFSAPFDCKVGVLKVSQGAYVKAGDEIATFIDANEISVTFGVPEQLLSSIQKGQEVFVNDINGVVSVVDKMIDQKNHLGTAKADLKACASCVVGSQVPIRIVTHTVAKTLVIPTEAIFLKKGGQHVYRIVGDKAVLQAVQVGLENKGISQILSGLKAGDPIVLRGQTRLYDGEKIRVQK